ncbi:MAG: sugar phosphate isomerase/epimerase [Ruminococcaceae bacterium]|nr:sugar phosphate isomerase/epimerase [Oscillospiraceae bacterium]
MNNKIYCSSGTMVGRINNYNYNLFTENIKEIEADGFELMMVAAYYPVLSELISAIEKTGANIPVVHAEKDIGEAFAETDRDILSKAFDAFETNCRVGKHLASEKIVLHLWSGLVSDSFFKNNLAALPYLYDIAAKYSLELLIENVPCTTADPFSNLSAIDEKYPHVNFIFDTRFGAFHEQTDKFLSSEWLTNGKIRHMHFSDYVGPAHDFRSLRPIPHLGCGLVGFDSIMPVISEKYHGSITLESPELHAEGPDTEKLNNDLRYIKKWVRK